MSIAPSEWDAFFDGSADVATRARIDSALVSDAAVRQAYLEQARFHWQVGSALRHFQGTIDGGGSTGGGPLAGPWFWAGGTTLLLALVMAGWLLWPAAPAVVEAEPWRLVAGELRQADADEVLTTDTPLPVGAPLLTGVARQATLASGPCRLYCGPVSDLQVTDQGEPLPRQGRFLIAPTEAERPWELPVPGGRLRGLGPAELLLVGERVQARGPDLQVASAAEIAVLPPVDEEASEFGCRLMPAVAARYRRGEGPVVLDPQLGVGQPLLTWTPGDLLARHGRYAVAGGKPRLADGRLLLPVVGDERTTIQLPLMDAGDAWSVQTDFRLVDPAGVAEYLISCGPSIELVDPAGSLQANEERFVSSESRSTGQRVISFAIRFARVGSYQGHALFEVACFADGACYNSGWVVGYPSAVLIRYRACGMSFGPMRIAPLDLPLADRR